MVPEKILTRIKANIKVINSFNQAIVLSRELSEAMGQPGRYEYELRSEKASSLDAPLAFFAEFEAMATQKGINPLDIYGKLGGKPEVLPWSAEAAAWMR